MVIPNSHVELAHSIIAQTLQSLEQEFAQGRDPEHRQYTPSPDIIPIWPRPEEDHPLGPLSADKGGAYQRPPVLHIDIPSHGEEAPSIPDQSGGEEDVERMVLQTMPRPGRMLTRHLAGMIMDSINPLQALS